MLNFSKVNRWKVRWLNMKKKSLDFGNKEKKDFKKFLRLEGKKRKKDISSDQTGDDNTNSLEPKKEKIHKKAKKIKSEVKNEMKDRRRFSKTFLGIRSKILAATFIPIVLMVVFGILCYVKATNAITTIYQNSTTDTLNAVSDYITLGLESVKSRGVEFILSDSVTSYYNRFNEKEVLEDIQNYRQLTEELVVVQSTNRFIGDMHIFGKIGRSVSSSMVTSTIPEDLYYQFVESVDGKSFEEAGQDVQWVGNHSFLDEKLQISNDEYAISIIRKMSFGLGYVVMDISSKKIAETLDEIDYGEGSILGFVTVDGKETLSNTDELTVFSELPYYKESVLNEEMDGHSYQTYNNQDYIYVYSKVGDTGSMVCALVPKVTITRQADSIKMLIVVFTLFASIIAILAGTIIAGGIGSAISKLMKSISQAAKGDLTAKFETKRKDELQVLSNGLSDMVGNMRNLIGEVAEVGTKVSDSASVLSATSEDILYATKDISLTIDEIEKGVVQQATDTENCSGQMVNLSEKINQVYSSTYEIEQIANDTKSIVGSGINIIDDLKDKTKATSDVTQVVIQEIEALEVQSNSIGNFVGIINEIASQTNLLSLNASIEAARAGEAGRGFAVVADEIRKLADQSVKAANEIKDIVTDIQNKTQNTALTAKQAEDIVESQTVALHKTVDVFEEINNHVEKLANNLDIISIGVKGIESAKEDTVDAISNISAVSEETAAASEEVSTTANNQIGSVENLSNAALELANDAKKLEEAIQIFRIN